MVGPGPGLGNWAPVKRLLNTEWILLHSSGTNNYPLLLHAHIQTMMEWNFAKCNLNVEKMLEKF